MKKEKIGFQRQPEIWLLLALLLLGYFLFFHNMGDRYIWSPDQNEYALVNREMLEDGHWLHPNANGKPYSIEPPLFNWIGSFFSLLNGEVTEFTSRLPSTLAGLGLPLYSWWMAGDWLLVVLPISVLCIIGAVVSFIFLIKNKGLLAVITLVLFISGTVTYGSGAVVGKVNDRNAARSFCFNIKDKIQGDAKLKMYNFYRPHCFTIFFNSLQLIFAIFKKT